MNLDERRVPDLAAAFDDVDHVDVLRHRRAYVDAHQGSQPRRSGTLGVAQVRLAHFPALRGEYGADRAAFEDRRVLRGHGGVHVHVVTYDRERAGSLLVPAAAKEVRHAELVFLLEELDTVAAEG